MTTSEFTPPAELTEGTPSAESNWRSRIWLYVGLGVGALLLVVIAIVVVPALLQPTVEAPQTGAALAPVVPAADPPSAADPTVEQVEPTNAEAAELLAFVQEAELDPETVATFEKAVGMSFAEFSALSDEEAFAVMWGTVDENDAPLDLEGTGNEVAMPPNAVPATASELPANPSNLRQQMLNESDAAGPGELPMTDEAAERAMVAVGLAAPEAAPVLDLVLVQGRVNTGGGTLNVRRQPGIGAPIVGQVSDGSAIDLSAWGRAADGSIWVRVQDPNAGPIDQGWVFALLVDMDDDHTALPQVTDFN